MTKTKTSRNYRIPENITAGRFASAWANPGGECVLSLESGARAYRALIKNWSTLHI